MSENLKRNSTQNIDPNSSTSNFEMPRKKKSKLGIQKEEEISAAFISNSNEVIYFKIIHSEEEFKNFQNLTNLEHCFNPQFTNQIFENELITGYKNLKILISLTPRFFFPHFKIIYDKCLKVKDDIELILKNHFDNLFETNEAKYLEKLKYDLGDSESIFENDESRSDRPFITFPPKGKLISEGKLDDKKLAIYHINVVKDKFTEENFNYQCICTFFIDGASFIPYEDSFWSYYIIYEMIQDNQEMENPKKLRFNVLGYTTTLNVNLSLNSHRTMVSQFLVLPPFQRKGLGHFLLDKVYSYLSEKEDECIEITTEDPAEEFILLRDVTLLKKIINLGYLNKFIAQLPLRENTETNEKIFSNIFLIPKEVDELAKTLKITKFLIKRCVIIFKYSIISSNPEDKLYKTFKKECQTLIYKWNRGDFELDYITHGYKYGVPVIYFDDEPEFDVAQALLELHYLNNSEQTKMLFAELENELKKIGNKCGKFIKEFNLPDSNK